MSCRLKIATETSTYLQFKIYVISFSNFEMNLRECACTPHINVTFINQKLDILHT